MSFLLSVTTTYILVSRFSHITVEKLLTEIKNSHVFATHHMA